MLKLRIFKECTGKFHICNDNMDYLDTRGIAYDTSAQATQAAFEDASQQDEKIEYLTGSGVSKFVARKFGVKVRKLK